LKFISINRHQEELYAEQETKQIDNKSVGHISRVVMAFLKV
jgi:hypothetical protein